LNKYALISVSDKTNIVEFAKVLIESGYKIIATGSSAKHLKINGLNIIEISEFTTFPEIFGGRVKTLHPKIFGGILSRRENETDIKEAKDNVIENIDIVCVNLYPFKQTVENSQSTFDEIIEKIDVGGPSLMRASAKNYKYVSILSNPSQYDEFIIALKKGIISQKTREKLAAEAFAVTADYDIYISNYLNKKFEAKLERFLSGWKKENDLRYGENPHQSAALYGSFHEYFELFRGKELSYNNILDLVSAAELSRDLGEKSCVIVKHNNPAGAAIGENILQAYEKALKCDPVSAYGGIVVFQNAIDKQLAEKLNEIFLEIICAPGFTEEAVSILSKKKDRRLLLQIKKIEDGLNFRHIPGGIIVQDSDSLKLEESKLKIVTEKCPSDKEMEDMKFAWIVAKHTKSNAIVFVKDMATIGVGAGQMSRLDSVKLAFMKGKERGHDFINSVAASDAFFPFADGLLEIINCGATAVIQPGGSVRDKEVITAANDKKISMVFTGIRHFKH
jgi:phosphoribosylaminoimidazolecarboxamide formyltransferase/IMP cyclohydrolase